MEMEKSATGIFEHAGIKLLWVEGSRTARESNKPMVCDGPSGGTTLRLLVLNDSRQVGSHTLGWTTLHSYRVAVDYKRAHMLAQASTIGLSTGQILGHAAAHEIGHVLLGTGAHTP